MTEDAIKAADLVINKATDGWLTLDYFAKAIPIKMSTYSNLGMAIDSLVENRLFDRKTMDDKMQIKINDAGKEIKSKNKGYGEFLNQKSIQAIKEERDEEYKHLQMQDLKRKVNEMNNEQLKFWNRQKWQFWLTFMIASAAFILSIINFIKGLYIK